MVNEAGHHVVAGDVSPSGPFAAPTNEDIAESAPGALPDPGHSHAAYHGKPSSWVAVSFIIAGFLCGGLGLVFGPTWWAFWVGVGLAAVGALVALFTDIFSDWY